MGPGHPGLRARSLFDSETYIPLGARPEGWYRLRGEAGAVPCRPGVRPRKCDGLTQEPSSLGWVADRRGARVECWSSGPRETWRGTSHLWPSQGGAGPWMGRELRGGLRERGRGSPTQFHQPMEPGVVGSPAADATGWGHERVPAGRRSLCPGGWGCMVSWSWWLCQA